MRTERFTRWAAAVAGVMLWLGGPAARAEDRGWLIGGGWGEADYGNSVARFDDGSITSGAVDNNELGWKLFAGYRFSKRIGLEVGYVDLINDYDAPTFEGVSDGTGSSFVSFPDGPVSVGLSPTGYFAEGVGYLPLGKALSIFGKVGLVRWDAETTVQDLNGESVRQSSGTDPVFGAGVEYRLKHGLALRAEYEVFTKVVDQDIDLFTAGISYTR
jgi:OOP family OmpA-OmpF porin